MLPFAAMGRGGRRLAFHEHPTSRQWPRMLRTEQASNTARFPG